MIARFLYVETAEPEFGIEGPRFTGEIMVPKELGTLSKAVRQKSAGNTTND